MSHEAWSLGGGVSSALLLHYGWESVDHEHYPRRQEVVGCLDLKDPVAYLIPTACLPYAGIRCNCRTFL